MRSASGGTGGSVSDLGVGGGSATADRWCQKKDGAVGLGVSGIVRKGGEPGFAKLIKILMSCFVLRTRLVRTGNFVTESFAC